MSIKVRKGQPRRKPKLMFIGEGGIGKTTLGNKFPNPLFICAENGLIGEEFDETDNYSPQKWPEMAEIVDDFKSGKLSNEWLVVDTIDWLEPMLQKHVATKAHQTNFADFEWGKGHILAGIEWRAFLSRLENLRKEKDVGIIFLSHCEIKTFNNPAGDNYDRYQAKISKQVSALTREWCDAVLFAKYETYTHKDTPKGKAKGVGGDTRVLYTTQTAAWDAKNRYGMPDKMALNYEEIIEAIKSGKPASSEALIEEINEVVNGSSAFTDDNKKDIQAAIEKNKKSETALKQILNKVRVKENS